MNDALLSFAIGFGVLAAGFFVFVWVVALVHDELWAWAIPIVGALGATAYYIGESIR